MVDFTITRIGVVLFVALVLVIQRDEHVNHASLPVESEAEHEDDDDNANSALIGSQCQPDTEEFLQC